MANYFDKVVGVEHIVAASSKMLATNGGAHIIDAVMDKDRDNGTLISKGALNTVQTFTAKDATAGEPIYLLLTPPIAYNGSKAKSAEKYFYNAQGETARALTVCVDDIFEVSAKAITPAATAPVVGQYVYWDKTTGKYIESATVPATAGTYICLGQIIEEVNYLNSVSYRILVLEVNKVVAGA